MYTEISINYNGKTFEQFKFMHEQEHLWFHSILVTSCWSVVKVLGYWWDGLDLATWARSLTIHCSVVDCLKMFDALYKVVSQTEIPAWVSISWEETDYTAFFSIAKWFYQCGLGAAGGSSIMWVELLIYCDLEQMVFRGPLGSFSTQQNLQCWIIIECWIITLPCLYMSNWVQINSESVDLTL